MEWTASDLDVAVELWGDPEVTTLIDARGALTREQIQERLQVEIDLLRDHGVQYWPMFLRDGGAFAGCCGLRPRNAERRVFELGFHVCRAQWGKGLATEAALHLVTHAFEDVGALALFAGHNPKNAASARVLEKAGFLKTHDELYPPTGLNHPSYLLVSPHAPHKLALDVAYDDDNRVARAAGVLFSDWSDATSSDEYLVELPHDAPYVPGELYRRELPGLLAIVDLVLTDRAIDTVVIDGYVRLGEGPGLGAHLADALAERGVDAVVIGVAKSAYPNAPAIEVRRGRSARSLFVSAVGLGDDAAARIIEDMHGPYRIPTLLSRVDRLTR